MVPKENSLTAFQARETIEAIEREHANGLDVAFDAADQAGVPVYHTNVMMCIATEFAPIRERAAQLKANPGTVRDILCDGAERASVVARDTISGVRTAMGFAPAGSSSHTIP